jgi:hypothetical protein
VTLTILGPAPTTDRSGARVFVRCDCGVEKVMRRKHVTSGQQKSCGCSRKAYNERRRTAAEERKRAPKIEMVTVPRFVPAHRLMSDAVLCDELVKLLDPPWGRLPYLRPTRVADICEALGCESHHILRAPLNIALCWDDDGEIVYGRLVAVGDVFGADVRETAARAMKRAA